MREYISDRAKACCTGIVGILGTINDLVSKSVGFFVPYFESYDGCRERSLRMVSERLEPGASKPDREENESSVNVIRAATMHDILGKIRTNEMK